MVGSWRSTSNGPYDPVEVELPATSCTVRAPMMSDPSPLVETVNDVSVLFARPDCASLAEHVYATSVVYQPASPCVPCGPEQDTTGGILSLPCTTWKVTKVAVSSRSVDPVPPGVVIAVCSLITWSPSGVLMSAGPPPG